MQDNFRQSPAPSPSAKLPESHVISRAKASVKRCSELRKRIPKSILAAIHATKATSESSIALGPNAFSEASVEGPRNQNYVKNSGLIFMPSSDGQFDRFLKQTRGPVVIDFYAKWLSEAIKDEKGVVKVVRVNVSKMPEIATRYGVEVTPTAVGVSCDGEEVGRLTGATNDHRVRTFVRGVVDSCGSSKKKRSSSAGRYESDLLVDEHDRAIRIPGQPCHHRYESRRRAKSETRAPPPPPPTHKQFFFTNESVASKPLTMIPGIGPIYASRMQSLGITSAKQLVGIYMQERNMVAFQHWLKHSFAMNERWASITTEALETVVRHMV